MAKSVTTTVGFIGTGKVSSKNINALLEDYVDALHGNVKFIIPVTVNSFTETIEYVCEFALNYDIDVEFVIDKTTKENKKLNSIVESIESTHIVEDVNKGVTGILVAAKLADLIIAWDDEDESCLDALDIAVNHNIKALDLTTGLSELEFNEDDVDAGSDNKTSDSKMVDESETDESSTTLQAEFLVSTVSTDSERSEGTESDLAEEDEGEELEDILTMMMNRIYALEQRVESLEMRT